MAYCRWSCQGSDVYCYQSDAGWVIHVADRRRKEECPISVADVLQASIEADSEKFLRLNNERHAWLDAHSDDEHWVAIGGPYKGQTFTDTSPGECADRLERIRASGLGVPQYAIDSLRDEQRDFDHDLVDRGVLS